MTMTFLSLSHGLDYEVAFGVKTSRWAQLQTSLNPLYQPLERMTT
jgi:hypothetical protein